MGLSWDFSGVQHKNRYSPLFQQRHHHTAEARWSIDRYEADLPSELPGAPAAHGAFGVARALLQNLGLTLGEWSRKPPADALGNPASVMLRSPSSYLRFRLDGTVDALRAGQQGLERVWGYQGVILEGATVRGQLELAVVKHLGTGRVSFRIEVFCRTDLLGNPLYWLGFHLFGVKQQQRLAQHLLEQVQRSVQERLEGNARATFSL